MSKLSGVIQLSNAQIIERLNGHYAFIENQYVNKKGFKHTNKYYQFPVMTKQETELLFNELNEVKHLGENSIEVIYSDLPRKDLIRYEADDFLLKSE